MMNYFPTLDAVMVHTPKTNFWKQDLKFFVPIGGEKYVLGEELYRWQLDHLASALLVEDYNAPIQVDVCSINSSPNLIFPPEALLSGSFVMSLVAKSVGSVEIKYDDIDIYFKTKMDAQLFVELNKTVLTSFNFDNPMCAYGYFESEKVNLIYGVNYDSPAHLISRFDIRACSMAIDPNSNMLHVVRGSVEDATRQILTFNPVPRGVSVRRLVKYVSKGFKLDKHQGVFFVDLVRTELYSAELELLTKDY